MSVAESGVGASGPSSAANQAQIAAQLVPYNTQPEYDLAIPPTTTDFARKLYNLLEDPLSDSSVVCWAPTRDRFTIKDTNLFSKTILPRTFHHSNFSSFVRQLNKYDFHKVKPSSTDNQTWTFQHRYFHKDRRQDLHHIQRKTGPSPASFDNDKARDGSPSLMIPEEEMPSRVEMESDVDRLMIENEELKTRVMELEQINRAMSLNIQSIEKKAFLQGEKVAIVRQVLAARDEPTATSFPQPIFQPAEPIQYGQISHSQVELAPSQAPLIIEDQRWSKQGDPPVIASTSLDSLSTQLEGAEDYFQEQLNKLSDEGVIPQIGTADYTRAGIGEFFRDRSGQPMRKRRRISEPIVSPLSDIEVEQLYREFGSDSSEHPGGAELTEQ